MGTPLAGSPAGGWGRAERVVCSMCAGHGRRWPRDNGLRPAAGLGRRKRKGKVALERFSDSDLRCSLTESTTGGRDPGPWRFHLLRMGPEQRTVCCRLPSPWPRTREAGPVVSR